MGWISQERIKVYPKVLIALYLGLYLYMVFSASGRLDMFGKPIGADFLAFWSISRMVIDDDPKEVYNQEKMYELQKRIIGVYHKYPIFYPPSSLIFMAPLALLPYIPSFIIWLAGTLVLYLFILYRIAPNLSTIWLLLAFPGTFQNFIFGQNGFLVGAMIGGGLLLVDKSPVMAGVLLGLSFYKPHMVVLIPFALLAQRNWKAFGSMFLTTASMILISLFAFDYETWEAFWKSLPHAMEIIERQEVRLYNMTSIMAMNVVLGANVTTAKIIHSMVSIFSFAIVIWIWLKRAPFFLRASSLILGTILISPYIHVYDLSILALPIAWMGWETFKGKKHPSGTENLLSAAWIMPLFTTLIAKSFKIQVAPFVILSLLIFSFYWAQKLLKTQEFYTESSPNIPLARKSNALQKTD